MPGQNNMYGSQDDPFGYGQQQAYWQQQRAADAAKSLTPATKPLPIKQTMPTQPQAPDRVLSQDRPDLMPRNYGSQQPAYQSPYGRGYVPPPWGSQQIPNPGSAQGNGGMTNYGLVWRTGPNGERVNIPVDAIGTPRDPQSPNYQPITVGPTPPPGFDNIQMPPWAVKPMPNPIWNGPVPPRQELPDDIMGLSKIYGAPIPEGQKWADRDPRRAYTMPWNPPTQPTSGIWNGPLPPKQAQTMPPNWNPNDAASWEAAAASRGMSQRVDANTLGILNSRYAALIARGATPQDAMNNVLSLLTPAQAMGGPQQYGQQQAIPQWYTARLQQQR